ncbi:MAG: hypothetical protein ACOYIP_06925 [Coriobacteriales bacterium]|jgi:hypothetical protein
MQCVELASSTSLYNAKLLPEGVIHWSEAKDHLGETVTIYGEVASTYFNWDEYERWVGFPELDITAPPTFIEVGAKYPNEELVKIVIWGRNRGRFQSPPDQLFRNSTIVFTGKPYIYNDLVHVEIARPFSIATIDPIEGLYVDEFFGRCDNPDFQPVFSRRPFEEGQCEDEDWEACAFGYDDNYDDDYAADDENARWGIEYVDDGCGHRRVDFCGFVIDDEGNYIDSDDWVAEQRARYRDAW